jgi:hypothetical protein
MTTVASTCGPLVSTGHVKLHLLHLPSLLLRTEISFALTGRICCCPPKEMLNGCGIGAWLRNSRVILASAPNADGPFVFEKELFGVFSHEPAVTRAPTGEYVVYFTSTVYGCAGHGGCIPAKDCNPHNRSDCPQPAGAICTSKEQCSGGRSLDCRANWSISRDDHMYLPTLMSWAVHPKGPYSKPVVVFNGSDGSAGSLATGDTNFAAVIRSDGSVVGIWRGPVPWHGHQYQYMARAGNWKDPSTYAFGRTVPGRNIFPELAAGGEHANCGVEVRISCRWLVDLSSS